MPYEEYQTNPNPGFNPTQRYGDAGGYLRSILGSFLNKRLIEQQREDEKAVREAQMAQAEKFHRESLLAADPTERYRKAQEDATAESAALGLMGDEATEYIQSGIRARLNPRMAESAGEKAAGTLEANMAAAQDAADKGLIPPGDILKLAYRLGEYSNPENVARIAASSREAVAKTQAGATMGAAQVKAETEREKLAAGGPAKNKRIWYDRPVLQRAIDSVNEFLTNLTKSGLSADENQQVRGLRLDKARGILAALERWKAADLPTTPLTEEQRVALMTLASDPDQYGKPEGESFLDLFHRAPLEPDMEDEGTGPSEGEVVEINGKKYLATYE